MIKKKKLPHSRRDIDPTKPIHCILKTILKISFHEKNAYHYIISLIKKVEAKYYVNIFQYFISRNHLHFFILTPNKEMISNALRYIGSMLARYFNKKLRRKGHFLKIGTSAQSKGLQEKYETLFITLPTNVINSLLLNLFFPQLGSIVMHLLTSPSMY